MKLSDFLTSDVPFLPKTRSEKDFLKYYRQISTQYLNGIKNLDGSSYIADIVLKNALSIEDLAEGVASSIKCYLDGQPYGAYDRLSTAISKVMPFFKELISSDIEAEWHKNLYRLRTSDGEVYDRSKMFHIAFDLRHLVKTQRYSIPGFPSLYLSSSVFTAWKELQSPNIDRVLAVRVQANETLKVLDFGLPPNYTAEMLELFEKHFSSDTGLLDHEAAKIICWPLLAACSIRTMHPDATFKPEYIIPQLILQFVRNKECGTDIDGIRYFSLHFGQRYHSLELASNYVFPVQSSHPLGLCPYLKRKFSMTDTVSMQLVRSIRSETDTLHVSTNIIEIVPGIPTPYKETDFGVAESYLQKLSVTTIS